MAFLDKEEIDEVIDIPDDKPPSSDSEEEEEKEEEPGMEEPMDGLDALLGFSGHSGEPIYTLAMHSDGQKAISGGGDDTGSVWDFHTGERSFVLEGHTDSVIQIDVNFDGTLVASAGMDGCVRVWNLSNGKCVHVLEGAGEAIEFLDWHPRGSVIVAGSGDGLVWLWNASSGKLMQTFAGHQDSVSCGGFTRDGKQIITGSNDGTCRLWAPQTGECVGVLKGMKSPVTCLALSPITDSMLCGTAEGELHIFSLKKQLPQLQLENHNGSVECVGHCFSKVHPYWATAGMDGQAIVWDAHNGKRRSTMKHPDGVTCMQWHPTEPMLFTGCLDGIVRLWDGRSGDLIREWKGHDAMITALAVSGDGLHVISGSDNGMALVFGVE